MSHRIGITGGIGSGKSVVSRLLRLLDVPVYDSDTEAKLLTNSDAVIKDGLNRLLEKDLYASGTLDKAALAVYLFADHEHAARVNAIIHPRVKTHFESWCQAHAQFPLIGIESAILYESGLDKLVDSVVMVYAPKELRIERAVARDASSRLQIQHRIEAQMDDEQKRRAAQYTLVNDDNTPLIPQVLKLIALLSKKND